MLPRFVALPTQGKIFRFIAIEAVIEAHLDLVFPGFTLKASGAFRVLRDSDLEMDEEAEDLVRYFRSAIQRRRRGRVIRGIPVSSTCPYTARMPWANASYSSRTSSTCTRHELYDADGS